MKFYDGLFCVVVAIVMLIAAMNLLSTGYYIHALGAIVLAVWAPFFLMPAGNLNIEELDRCSKYIPSNFNNNVEDNGITYEKKLNFKHDYQPKSSIAPPLTETKFQHNERRP